MLFIKSFKNYDEFKEVFQIVEHGNGVKSRKNKVLLGWLKDRRFLHYWLQLKNKSICPELLDDNSYLCAKNMNDAEKSVKFFIDGVVRAASKGFLLYKVSFPDIRWSFYSRDLQLDNAQGLCEDGDTRAVRYINTARDNRIFKMKAGKFITTCMEELFPTRILPEQVKRWIGEEFARAWQAFAEDTIGETANLTLTVGKCRTDFEDIYDSSQYAGDFHSCMVDGNQYDFYYDAVNASAACLRNASNEIVARCIIFNHVTDESGDVWRLAERQYSSGCNDVLKQILVNRLISEGYIDGYKKVGVDCHDNRNFVANDGTPLKDKKFSIKCWLEEDDTLSYQDSFVYYDKNNNIAYNFSSADYTDELNVTDSVFTPSHEDERWSELENEWIDERDAYYDEYNDSYIDAENVVYVLYHGREIGVHEDHMDDFLWSEYEEEYIHTDDAVELYDGNYCLSENAVCDIAGDYCLEDECKWSAYLGEWIHENDAVWSNDVEDWLYESDASYSELVKDWFDADSAMLKAEEQFTKEHTLTCVNA